MKRIGITICLSLILILCTTSLVFGADFKVEQTSPANGSTGMAIDNMGVKVFFTESVNKKDNQKANAKLCKLTDNKGKEVPSLIVYSDKDPSVMLVLADTSSDSKKKADIEGKTKYTLTIEKGFKSSDGNTLAETKKVSFTTMDPKGSMKVSIIMMGLMMVGMSFFMIRDAKKQNSPEAKKAKTPKDISQNPYKEAKKKGKSVEEVVATQEKKKEKAEAEEAKRQQAIKERADKREAKEAEKEKKKRSKSNLHVAAPAPISAAGSNYKDPLTYDEPEEDQ